MRSVEQMSERRLSQLESMALARTEMEQVTVLKRAIPELVDEIRVHRKRTEAAEDNAQLSTLEDHDAEENA